MCYTFRVDPALAAFTICLVVLAIFLRPMWITNQNTAQDTCVFGALAATLLAFVPAWHFGSSGGRVTGAILVPEFLGGLCWIAVLAGAFYSVKNAYDRLEEFQEHLPALAARLEVELGLEGRQGVDDLRAATGWMVFGANWITGVALCANLILLLDLTQHPGGEVLAVALWVWLGFKLSGFCLHLWMRRHHPFESCLC